MTVSACLAVLLGAASAAAAPRPFDLQGHRGARGLAPENTLAAFRAALSVGVTTLELDVAVTRDGALMVSHDPVLSPDLTRGPDGRWLEAPGPAIRPDVARAVLGAAGLPLPPQAP